MAASSDNHDTEHSTSRVTPGLDAAEAKASAQTFDAWAPKYDSNVLSWGYKVYQAVVSQVFALHDRRDESGEAYSLSILDAGCGSGLVGRALVESVPEHLTLVLSGIDHSQKMLDLAHATGTYNGELKQVSIGNNPLPALPAAERLSDAVGNPSANTSVAKVELMPDESFDVITAAGVFQPGGAPLESIIEFVRVLRVGGFAVYSVQLHWFLTQQLLNIASSIYGAEIVYISKSRPYTPDIEPEAEYKLVTIKKSRSIGNNNELLCDCPLNASAVLDKQKQMTRSISIVVDESSPTEEHTDGLVQLGRCRYPEKAEFQLRTIGECRALARAFAATAEVSGISTRHIMFSARFTNADLQSTASDVLPRWIAF